jgi:hypothetical protein
MSVNVSSDLNANILNYTFMRYNPYVVSPGPFSRDRLPESLKSTELACLTSSPGTRRISAGMSAAPDCRISSVIITLDVPRRFGNRLF